LATPSSLQDKGWIVEVESIRVFSKATVPVVPERIFNVVLRLRRWSCCAIQDRAAANLRPPSPAAGELLRVYRRCGKKDIMMVPGTNLLAPTPDSATRSTKRPDAVLD
jgi:hypothetical protein